jgi:iron complex transport system ATP-binding protein
MLSRERAIDVLHVANLVVRRGQAVLLDNVTWRVAQGQHWVILGPNGCGKTSLLKTITGYLTPTEGEISLLGRWYGESDWRELRLRVGLVTSALQMQIPVLEPAIETVISGRYAQLDLWAATTAADRRAGLKALREVGLGDLAERPWMHLSQGERQRVLIARARMARPSVMILDEPCAGLDPVARSRFLREVEAMARRPKAPALVLVTHHVEEITPAFTHVLLLSRGRVLDAGPRREVLTSRRLSEAFDAPVRLRRTSVGFRLDPA